MASIQSCQHEILIKNKTFGVSINTTCLDFMGLKKFVIVLCERLRAEALCVNTAGLAG